MKDQTAFSTRFARHKDELEWLFMELYHNREGLEVLEREMAEAYNARSAELKALDKARSADPDWYKRGNMFGMTMYTDLFAGNLKELAKKLPYLKEQKLTYLHLMPLLQMLAAIAADVDVITFHTGGDADGIRFAQERLDQLLPEGATVKTVDLLSQIELIGYEWGESDGN